MSITLASDVIIIPYFLDKWRTIFIIFSQPCWVIGKNMIGLETEAWPSGWRRTTRNRVGWQQSRRFESSRFRHFYFIKTSKSRMSGIASLARILSLPPFFMKSSKAVRLLFLCCKLRRWHDFAGWVEPSVNTPGIDITNNLLFFGAFF